MGIYTVTPLAVLSETGEDYNFFCRDMGLTCHGLQAAGVESKVVLLDFPKAKQHKDMIRTSLKDMENPEFWKGLQLDGAVLGAWAAPKYTPIARAIKKSGTALIIRCDSGWAYSQWQKSIRQAFYENFLECRYGGKGYLPAVMYAGLKTTAYYFPSAYEKKVAEHMGQADLIMNETPEGVRCLKNMLFRLARQAVASRVKYIPHPVDGAMVYNEMISKEKRIIAVGRWGSYQKNTPLFIRSISTFLKDYPEYEVHVFGGGEDVLYNLLYDVSQDIKERIKIRGKISNAELRDEYQKSRILFMPSRSEGSSVAAEEALNCGCSVVGSDHIFCMKNFVSKNSGTLSRTYSESGMVEALQCEVEAWEKCLRDPVAISSGWVNEFSLKSVISEICSAVAVKADRKVQS